ncbi:hypothetical protein F5Y04DRAFT_37661 [Hypomontagnella monticulosa]|nr:hypothetical protein F5Y04DRAFT_37661 [Hypomontagnella monticulosa]
MNKLVWRRAGVVTTSIRTVTSRGTFNINPQPGSRYASSIPTIAQPSFWKGMIPKPFRRSEQSSEQSLRKKPKSKEWNPATFFIVIFLFIGSMSIQMIALRRDFETFMRRSEVHIGLLREVVEKLQRGEEVDVEKTLGSGDAEKEKEWEEVLKEIERDDILKNTKKAEKPRSPTPVSAKTEVTNTASSESTEPQKAKTGSYSSFF